MKDALSNVFDRPTSVSARRALAIAWRAAGDPRVELLERELTIFDYQRGAIELSWEGSRRVEVEIEEIIARSGPTWAGRIHEVAESYRYQLGMIGTVTIAGDRFVAHASEILRLAPLLQVALIPPIDIEALCRVPELARLHGLWINGKEQLGDREAIMLAGCAYLRNLEMANWGGNIGDAGCAAIASSPHLRNIKFVDLTANPCEHSLTSIGGWLSPLKFEDSWCLVGPAGQPLVDEAIRRSYNTESQTVHFPPYITEFCWTEVGEMPKKWWNK